MESKSKFTILVDLQCRAREAVVPGEGGMDTEIRELDSDVGKVADRAHMEVDDDGMPKRTGTMWTASAHIITAVIGSGVLSLGWGIAQLGWIAGVSTLLIFSTITFYSSSVLADCYRYPHPTNGTRNYTYIHAVKAYLGGKKYKVCGFLQYTMLSVMVIGYTITSSISMVAIKKSICFHERGHKASCKFSNNPFMICLGVVEIFASQIPNIHKLSWLSTVAATMSFSYATIGIGLSIATIASGKGKRTSLGGVEVGVDIESVADKTWRIFRALGDMAFAFTYSAVLIEIQDTLSSTAAENKVMKRANMLGMSTATTLYVMCGCLGYATFGNLAPGNLLTGFGFYEPFWLIDLANVFIVVHLVGAYQVLAQPVFSVVESWANKKWPKSKFVREEYPIGIGIRNMKLKVNMLRLIWRTGYVVIATILAMAMPFFNDILAMLGAIGYWPLTVYFPVELHFAQNRIERFSIRWIGLQILSFICLLVSLAAAIGSIQGISYSLHQAKPFSYKE